VPPKKRVIVPGSQKQKLPRAKIVGDVDPEQRIEITVVLRRRGGSEGLESVLSAAAAPPKAVSREEFAGQLGADPADVAKVEAFAHAHDLEVVDVNRDSRRIRVAGSIEDLTAAFRPKLKRAKAGNRVVRTRTGGISVPDELGDIVVAVLGFDNRPAATPHLRRHPGARRASRGAQTAHKRAFTPPQIASLYDFPPDLDGAGQCIAIVELNDFRSPSHGPPKAISAGYTERDLRAYFAALGIEMPEITAIGVESDGSTGANLPGPDAGADGEVMLDIEVAAAVAPKAKIAVYFALNTDNGFLAALTTAIHDKVHRPSVVSISWGSSEDDNTGQALRAFNEALQDAAALGVTVCCSAGDDGSSDAVHKDRDGKPHVDFPASSPYALACGGTRVLASRGEIVDEAVWRTRGAATGGGVSNKFDRPPYQAGIDMPASPRRRRGRGVPDVAGDADPATGYRVRLVGGGRDVFGGTSAVAPLWAALVALINQHRERRRKPPLGFLNPRLYAMPARAGAFRDILEGTNDLEKLGKYAAGPGWDACTGLGSPNGARLLEALAD